MAGIQGTGWVRGRHSGATGFPVEVDGRRGCLGVQVPFADTGAVGSQAPGGEANVKACLHAAKEVLQKFGLPLRYTIMVSTDPMASSAPGHREIQFVNVHLNNTADFLGGVTVPYCESCGAHEASHLGFSARNDRGRAVLDVLKERQRKGLPYLSTYHAMGGHLEGTAEAGAFYTLKPRVLLREAPEVYAAVAYWFGDGSEP